MKRLPEPEYMDAPEEARVYAEADFNTVNQAFVERLLALAPAPGARLVLDLGVGPGDIPARIAVHRPAWRIIGLDASSAMLAFAQSHARTTNLSDRIQYLVGDAKHLPFPSSTYDLVISNSILHHVADPVALWREAKKTAKPGAFFLMRDLFRPLSTDAARAIVTTHAGTEPELLQEEFYRSLLAAYTVPEIQGQLRQAGLTSLQVEAVSDRHLDVYGHLA